MSNMSTTLRPVAKILGGQVYAIVRPGIVQLETSISTIILFPMKIVRGQAHRSRGCLSDSPDNSNN